MQLRKKKKEKKKGSMAQTVGYWKSTKDNIKKNKRIS